MTTTPSNLIITTRGSVIENTHILHLAITDVSGNLVTSLGDPHRTTLIRSCAKPLQALAIIESGALELYDLDDKDLAIACASHNAEPTHLERARGILEKAGLREDDLMCGGHASLLQSVNDSRTKEGTQISAILSNCSGKHAAMLAAAKAIGTPLEGYHELEHPIQQRVKKIVEETAGVPPEDIQWAIDGCNMATPAYSLDLMAKTFAAFAAAADEVAAYPEKATQRTKNMARVYHVMIKHADMVAGTKRYCTEMMYAQKGTMFGKIGADACYAFGIRESERTRRILGCGGAMGIAAKVEDGNLAMLYAALEEILEQLDLSTQEAARKMTHWHHPRLTNTMDIVIGHVAFPFKVKLDSVATKAKVEA